MDLVIGLELGPELGPLPSEEEYVWAKGDETDCS